MYFHKSQEKPRKWGSFQDVQFAVMKNAEKIYQIDPDSMVLCMPLFWGLPPLDFSGKNNHGTNHGATYKDGSLDFDGNDYIDIGAQSFLGDEASDNPITFSAIVRLDDLTTALPFISTDAAAGAGHTFVFGISGGDDLLLVLYDADGNNRIGKLSQATQATGILAHYTVTYNGNSTEAGIKLYKNGLQLNTDSFTLGSYTATPGTGNWLLGGRWLTAPPEAFHNGLIDEVHISNVVRTAEQIALFHDHPWALYQPISRPVYFLPSIEAIMNQFQKSNLGSDLFNGALL